MKYALFGGVASALMLFGASHVYGMTGSLDFAGIGRVLAKLDAASRPEEWGYPYDFVGRLDGRW